MSFFDEKNFQHCRAGIGARSGAMSLLLALTPASFLLLKVLRKLWYLPEKYVLHLFSNILLFLTIFLPRMKLAKKIQEDIHEIGFFSDRFPGNDTWKSADFWVM